MQDKTIHGVTWAKLVQALLLDVIRSSCVAVKVHVIDPEQDSAAEWQCVALFDPGGRRCRHHDRG